MIDKPIHLDRVAEQRFWSKVSVDADRPDVCWPWKAGCDTGGYGQFSYSRRTFKAHRVAWVLKMGQVQNGLCVLHTCDNPKCCNPSHLFLGTSAENTADKVSKGRQARGSRISDRQVNLVRGERHHDARLTPDSVVQIRTAAASGETCRSLSERYGISPQGIRSIVKRRNWKHVP